MSARVINAAVLTEFCKIRTSCSPNNIGRNVPCGRQLNRIKRDLFGPVNPAETSRLFAEELEKHQERAIKKWGFDFRAGAPLTANTQFIWERVSFQESAFAPNMYTLTRAAHVRPPLEETSSFDSLLDERAEREHCSLMASSCGEEESCESGDELQNESALLFKLPASGCVTSVGSSIGGAEAKVAPSPSYARMSLRKRQPKITEYMKERKRLAQTPKKISPAKRVRTSSGSSSSSSQPHSPHAPSISSHFKLRSGLQRHN